MNYDTQSDEPIYDIKTEPTEINTIAQIGYAHTNHCEDSVYAEESSIYRIVCGVFDGCSSGTDSHFASNLIVKVLRKSVENIEYNEFMTKEILDPESFGGELFRLIHDELKIINNSLRLKYDELLSTVLISVYDKSTKEIFIGRVGDGIIKINDKVIEFYEDHKSDYIGYHLSMKSDEFYERKVQKYKFTDVTKFALSTDGIYSFRRFQERKKKGPNSDDIINYLLSSQEYRNSPNWIKNKVDYLERKHGLNHIDDIGVVVFEKI